MKLISFLKAVKPGDWKLAFIYFMIPFAPYAWSLIFLLALQGGHGARDSIIYASLVTGIGGFLLGLALYLLYILFRNIWGSGKPV